MSGDVRVVAQDFHRNGIGGSGFVVSLVEWQGTEAPTPHFVAISFFGDLDEDATPGDRREAFRAQTAVLQLDRLAAGHIEMHGEHPNAWRGADHVGPSVADAWVERCRTNPGLAYDPFDSDWTPEEGA